MPEGTVQSLGLVVYCPLCEQQRLRYKLSTSVRIGPKPTESPPAADYRDSDDSDSSRWLARVWAPQGRDTGLYTAYDYWSVSWPPATPRTDCGPDRHGTSAGLQGRPSGDSGPWRGSTTGLAGASCGQDQVGPGQPTRYAIGARAQPALGGVTTRPPSAARPRTHSSR